jgi:peptide/nickel transport system substrate-binding protein
MNRIPRIAFRYLIAALMLLALSPVLGQRSIEIVRASEPDNLNPMYTTALASVIYNPLWLPSVWTYDDGLELVPILVTEIPSVDNGGISADGLTITLRLRDDLRWSDGEPLTSSDFLFTYEMIMDDANASVVTSPYSRMTAIEAPDAQTVIVSFAEPHVTWAQDLFPWVLPEHVLRPVYERDGNLQDASWNRLPTVGYGPYIVREWVTGSYILFEQNPNWWGDELGLDSILVSFIDDANTTRAAMLQGRVDITNNFNRADLPELEAAGFDLQQQPSKFQLGLFFNLREDPEGAGHPALKDPQVRLAIALALDRDLVNETINQGLIQTPKSFWGMIPDVLGDRVTGYPFDPEEASILLEAAGWSLEGGVRRRDGQELRLRYVTSTGENNRNIQAVFQQQLQDVGIAVEVVNMPSDQLFNLDTGPLTTGAFDLIMFGDGPSYPDPYINYFLCDEVVSPENPFGWNASGFCDPELDALFQESQRTVDAEARREIFRQITNIFQDQVYWIGISEDPASYLVSSRVTGFRLGGPSPFWNVAEWGVAE